MKKPYAKVNMTTAEIDKTCAKINKPYAKINMTTAEIDKTCAKINITTTLVK